MIKKRYVKKIYVEECYCDECGSPMKHTGMVLSSYPAQYPFNCTNPKCGGHKIFWEDNLPGKLKYEFEDETHE